MGTVQQYDSTTVVLQTILPVKFESKISKRVASKRTTVLPGTHNLLASLHPYQPGQYNLKLVKDGVSVSSGTTWY